MAGLKLINKLDKNCKKYFTCAFASANYDKSFNLNPKPHLAIVK